MTKIKYLILAFILLLIPNLKVNAAYVDVSGLYFNNKSLTTTNYISATASSNTFKFTSQTSGSGSYYRFIFCMDTKVNTWSDNLSELTDVNFIYTNKSCTYYNSNYTGGKITYLLATYTPTESPSFTATITFNAASNFSLQLINASASETPFNIDTSQDYSGVLDNLSKEQQKTQETIKDTFEDCTNYIPKYVKTLSNVFIQNNGTELLSDSDGLSVLVYEVPKVGIEYSFKLTSGNRLRVSSSNILYSGATTNSLSKVLLNDGPVIGNIYKITPNQRYIYLYLSNTSDSVGSVSFDEVNFCANKIDKTNDKLDATNDKLNDLNGNISSEDYDNPDFSNLETADDTPISDLVTMPLSLLNKFINAMSGTCKPYNLPFFNDSTISFPCFNGEKYFGSNLWNTIGLFMSFFMIYEIGMLAVQAFNDFTSLRDTYDSLYTPKHAKPLGKHTSEVE